MTKKRVKSLKDIWKQVPPDYYEKGIHRNPFQMVWHKWKWRTMENILKTSKIRPLKILDVGCSSGHITARIAKFYPRAETIGIDSYDRAIKYGRKIHPQINFRTVDAHKLPFKENNFDLIVCIETLEHLVNPEKVILEMKRCLNKNGSILIGQDTDSFLFKMIWFIWTKTYGRVWRNSHFHPFTPEDMKNLLEKSSLKIMNKKFSQLGLEIFFLAKKR